MIATVEVNVETLPITELTTEGEPLWYEIVRDGTRVCTVDSRPDALFLFTCITDGETPWNKLKMVEVRDYGWTISEVVIEERDR